jgi:hypothetical protein
VGKIAGVTRPASDAPDGGTMTPGRRAGTTPTGRR